MAGRIIKYWLPVILCMTLIFGASTSLGRPENTSRIIVPFLLWLNPHMSGETIEKIHGVIRKTAHFVEYSLLGLLLWRLIHLDPALAPCRSREFLTALAARCSCTRRRMSSTSVLSPDGRLRCGMCCLTPAERAVAWL